MDPIDVLVAMLKTNVTPVVSVGSLRDTDEDQVVLHERGLEPEIVMVGGAPGINRQELNITVRGKRYKATKCNAQKAMDTLTFGVLHDHVNNVHFLSSRPRTTTPNHFERDDKKREVFQFRAVVEYLRRPAS